ncbi:MAG TPA: hypothetical protein VGB85_17360 [Nannocystis sp.]|jgi:hypothetical protein
MHPRSAALGLCLSLAAACGDDGRREGASAGTATAGSITLTISGGDASGTGTGGTPTTGEGGSGEGGTGSSTVDPSGDQPPKFDLGAAPDVGMQEQPEACAKVDLLFVIDNSSSMKNEQDNLVASFPGFVSSMLAQLANADSYHVGVVSTDSYDHNDDPCDNVLGGLITRTGGNDSSNQSCGPYASGKRYMSEADDLGARFTCAAQVGTDGATDEKPLEAAIRGLGPILNAPGECNDGFLRKDALLVLVLITDEEEEGSNGDPPDWYDSLVLIKGGIETNIVVLSLIGLENPPCVKAAEVGHRIIEFTEKFTYGSVGQICSDSYNLFFSDAIAVISEACNNFVPPA